MLGLTTDIGPDLRYLTDISYLPVPPAKHHGTTFGAPLIIGLLVLVGAVVSTAGLHWLRRGRRGRRRRKRPRLTLPRR